LTEIEAYCAGLRARIEEAYFNSENDLGWRLLASPAAVLDDAEIAFIGLNPGGNAQPSDHPDLSTRCESAYVAEWWGASPAPGQSPLQRQVRALFRKLQVEPERVLAGNLVPFRSPSWDRLKNREDALRFGEHLWSGILARARPRLVIGMGSTTYASLSRVLRATDARSVRVDWGNVRGMRANFHGGALIGLPHLSRFGIVTRTRSEPALRELFREDWSH